MKRTLTVALLSITLMTGANAQIATVGSIALSVGQWVVKNSKDVYQVRMEGTGTNEAQARRAAFAGACEQAIGTVVLTEREITKTDVTRDDLLTYSSCQVETYKDISTSNNRVVVDVWVSDSKIANRLQSMGPGQGTTVNGEQIRKDWERDQSKKKADEDGVAMMNRVLADYPRMAWTTKIVDTRVTRNNTGTLVLELNVEFKFSEKYLEALEECVERTRYSSWNSSNGLTGVRIYTGRFSNTAGVWKDSSVQPMWEQAFNRPFSLEVRAAGDSRPLVWRDVQTNLKDFTGYMPMRDGTGRYNSSFYVIDGSHTQRVKFHVAKRPDHSEERFINWVSTLTNVEARVVDNRI